jgi:hypothetical protein
VELCVKACGDKSQRTSGLSTGRCQGLA